MSQQQPLATSMCAQGYFPVKFQNCGCQVCICAPLIKQGWKETKISLKKAIPSPYYLINLQAFFCLHRSSLEFLATYLQLYPLPEKFQPVSPLGIAELNMGSYLLRHQLFNWLMPVNEEGTSTNDPLAFWASRTTSRYLMRFRECCILHFWVKKACTMAWVYTLWWTLLEGSSLRELGKRLGVHNMTYKEW